MTGNSTTHLQHCLDRLQAGDGAARDELLNAAGARLTKLARKMLRADGRLRRWEETDDVLQTALMRLLQALRTVTPATPREFFRLSARQIRLTLIDLARHHYGPHGAAAHHETLPPQGQERSDATLEPDRLAAWTEFHERIEALPEEQREVFELVWYQGMKHDEVGSLLNVSTKTVQRRWLAARERLIEVLDGQLPGS